MKATLVDSNVLIDILSGDYQWAEWSSQALARLGSEGPLVINPVIYAEVSHRYSRKELLDHELPADAFIRDEIPWAAAFLAGKAYVAYRQRGGLRRSPLPDFFIGAHAAVAGLRLLTRDSARYRTYFPRLYLVSPESGSRLG
ncbi:MAG TPA: type II toxin-antitoxin system VapC family toxin [Solirubrobacterales bacterium]|nr:type II toxin-antitoxin system VapC family toxin [Solirubrobacterales bacterium]